MAFRQPIVAPRRPDPLQEPQYKSPTIQVSPQQTTHDESREWVLFPASQAYSTSQTRTTFTTHTPHTAGRSRISDFGSIGITVRSDGNERDFVKDGDDGAKEEEDEEELDSLDEGLHAFHDPTVDRYIHLLGRSGTILPTHDGLGMFPPSSLQVQEHLWQFEQHNPRKRMADTQLSSSSLRRHLNITADADETKLDSERRKRIENWRIDQARLLLDEIEKQSRKMKRSQSIGQPVSHASADIGAGGVESSVGDSMHQHVGDLKKGVGGGGEKQHESGPKETLLEGITRRLFDLLGIDEFLLSIIFGDALPADEYPPKLVSSPLPELDSSPNQPNASSLLPEGHGRMLNRLTRELGFVIQQHLSEQNGAFSTHLHLPPDSNISTPSGSSPSLNQQKQPEKSLLLHDLENSSSAAPPSHLFHPTLKTVQPEEPYTSKSDTTTNAALWGIEEEEEEEGGNNNNNNLSRPLPSIAEERAYWERTPDVKSIFRLLHTRFSNSTADQPDEQKQQPQQSSLPNPNSSSSKNKATAAAAASLRRASVISQHHPLVSVPVPKGNSGLGTGPARRTTFRTSHHHAHTHHQQTNRQIFSSLLLRRTGNSTNSYSCSYSFSHSNSISCASSNLLGLKRSKSKSKSKSNRAAATASSNYWDLDLDLDLGWGG